MNTFKTNKGITLVALIITIIVLLILTVVAISSITDQGLFTKSQEAVNSYEDSRKEEEGKLTGYSSEINKYLQKDKTYSGYGVRIIISSDNKLTAYEEGVKVFENIQLVEISTPEDIVNPENYSKFYKISLGEDEEGIIALSKDEKILYLGDMAFELEEIYETPIVHSCTGEGFSMHYIQLSTTEALEVIKIGDEISSILNCEVRICDDLKTLKSEYNNFTIDEESDLSYKKVITDNEGEPRAVYYPSVDAWAGVGNSTYNGVLIGFNIGSPAIFANTTMTRDEINSYIQAVK